MYIYIHTYKYTYTYTYIYTYIINKSKIIHDRLSTFLSKIIRIKQNFDREKSKKKFKT